MHVQRDRGHLLTVRAVVETFATEAARDTLESDDPALDRLVGSVGVIARTEEMDGQRPNSLVIVPGRLVASGDVGLDLLLRRAAAVRASCLVVDAGPGSLPSTTRRLAEQHRIALWREPRLDHAELRARIEQLVRNPELVGAGVIREIGEALQQPAADLGELVDRIGRTIGLPTALLGPDGHPVAGPVLGDPATIAGRLTGIGEKARGVDTVVEAGAGRSVVLVTAFPLAADTPGLWLGALVPHGLDSRGGHVATCLRIGALALSAHLLQASLSHERENREAGAMLDDILRKGDGVALADVERAAALGWQLLGWHLAVQVRAQTRLVALPPAALARSLTQALETHGITARPVGLGDSVVFWTTTSGPPPAGRAGELVDAVRGALARLERVYPGLRLHAGVGGAHEGSAGIARSLEDARYALAHAESAQGRAVVQREDAMTASRLIRSWLPQGAARDVLATLLDPLRAADPSGQLLATLRSYLDNESNVSHAAESLRIHRNTAIQRLRRIRELLPVDLDDPADRLTIRLALRADG